MPKSLISIVVANYNSENTIRQTIESILNQTYPNFELIISDDGSVDNSIEIIKDYAQQDNRIKTVFNEHKGYVSKVLNAGFKLARGKYYGVVDCDDYIRKDCLELSLNFIEKENPKGLIYTDYIMIDENNKELGLGPRSRIKYNRLYLLLNFITYHFRLFHRDLYYSAGKFDESLERCSDYDFCLKASEISTIKQYNEPLYYYRMHSKQITKSEKGGVIDWTHVVIDHALKRRRLNSRLRLICQKYKQNNEIKAKYILVKRKGVTVFM